MSNTNLRGTDAAERYTGGVENVILDLRNARHVQSRLFPCRHTRIKGIDYHGECRTAGEVGGDFFDFQPGPAGSLVASVGDVSGHGISSALLMSALQVFLRGMTREGRTRLASIVERLNRSMYEISPDSSFATLFYARIDPRLGRLHYVNAGHEPALLIRHRSRRVVRLESTGTVVGMFNRAGYEERALAVEPGDLLLIYTDGLPEAASPHGSEFGEHGLLNIVENSLRASSAEIVNSVLDAVDEFTSGAPPLDDRTVVAIRVDQPAMEEQMQFFAREALAV